MKQFFDHYSYKSSMTTLGNIFFQIHQVCYRTSMTMFSLSQTNSTTYGEKV